MFSGIKKKMITFGYPFCEFDGFGGFCCKFLENSEGFGCIVWENIVFLCSREIEDGIVRLVPSFLDEN